MTSSLSPKPLLSADSITKSYGTFTAVKDVSLTVAAGETLALVGESGCGKTTLARCIGLLDRPDKGSVMFKGSELLQTKGAELKAARRQIQIVFQDPFGSLNPRFRVGDILAEPFIIHGVAKGAERRDRVEALLKSVGLSPDDSRRYPHEFSGGQRQRIAIARAMALEPALIIADEPVSALDVSIQSQILNLLMDLQSERGLAYLFISHDLAVVSEIADRVAVMNAGEIVESGPIETVFAEPQHAYTQTLIEAVPSL